MEIPIQTMLLSARFVPSTNKDIPLIIARDLT